MSIHATTPLYQTTYDRSDCKVGIVHLGFGAFHRAHQAVYFDDYMQRTGDLNWGIATVNLRASEAEGFARSAKAENGYVLKSVDPEGTVAYRRVRSHVAFSDWSATPDLTVNLLAMPSVKAVSITVTESGYYIGNEGRLNCNDPIIRAEIEGSRKASVYAFLADGLAQRAKQIDQPITIVCCDNLRGNGEKLRLNFLDYLELVEQDDLAAWVNNNVAFPNSMVDRITPRKADEIQSEAQELFGAQVGEVVQSEAFTQWVLEQNFVAEMPRLDLVGVEFVNDVDPYEEAKIRVLNGGHTCIAYQAALKGHETFDQAMDDEELALHFRNFELKEVLPALPDDIPLDTEAYLDDIAMRFRNQAIADSVERICADGFAKFQIFIRPTIEAVLENGNVPIYAIRTIASWYWFSKAIQSKRISMDYYEPSWDALVPLLEEGHVQDFTTSIVLWSDLPERFPQFSKVLTATITEMENSWPM